MEINGDIILGIIAAVILSGYGLYSVGYRQGSKDTANRVIEHMDKVFFKRGEK